jgi:glycosyltransferase involved in cell wall biosynthesis
MVSPLRILMTTQVVDQDHPILGFSHTWITELARHVEHVHVLALNAGRCNLPKNVTLWSLDKPVGKRKLASLAKYQLIAARLVLAGEADAIFVQQTEINVLLLSPHAWIRRIPILIFKAHSMSLGPTLRLANCIISKAVTSAETAYPISTPKKVVVGQGIDTEVFRPRPRVDTDEVVRIISMGRLSPVKRYETLIQAATILREERSCEQLTFHVFGGWDHAGYADYRRMLEQMVTMSDLGESFRFEGACPFSQVTDVYRTADMLVHTCEGASLDKVVLEAMASGLPVVAPHRPYGSILGRWSEELTFELGDPADLACRINALLSRSGDERGSMGLALRRIVERDHSTHHLFNEVVRLFEESTKRD